MCALKFVCAPSKSARQTSHIINDLAAQSYAGDIYLQLIGPESGAVVLSWLHQAGQTHFQQCGARHGFYNALCARSFFRR